MAPSSHPGLRGGAPPPLAEQRPERPDLPQIALRLIVLACLALTATADALRAWLAGRADAPAPPTAALTPEALGAHLADRLLALLVDLAAEVAAVIVAPPVSWGITLVATAASALLLAELALAGAWLVAGRRRNAAPAQTYLHVRPLRPQSRTGATLAATPHDLWRALHAAADPTARVTLSLHGRPDQPAALGATIAAGSSRPGGWRGSASRRRPAPAVSPAAVTPRPLCRPVGGRQPLAPVRATPAAHADGDAGTTLRASAARSLEKVLLGQDPEVAVDAAPDPLAAALRPGAVVIWQDLVLARPAHFPLRTPDAAGADLLGSLAAALRPPPGVACAEIQIAVRPRHESIHAPWRVLARRRMVDLRRKQAHFVSPEVAALDAKLADAAFDVSLRVVAVAPDPASERAAHAAVREVCAALGQYRARAGSDAQGFAPAGQPRRAAVPADDLLPRRGWAWRWAALALPLALAAAGALPWTAALPLVAAALAVLGARALAGGGLAAVRARAPRLAPLPALLTPLPLWRGPAVLSAAEASGLWHLPSPALRLLIDWLPARRLPAQPSMFIPDGATDHIALGHARRADGALAPVGIPLRSMRQVLHLTAGMGAGKTRALANMVDQLIPNGLLVLDGKGDDQNASLVATARQLVPLADEPRLILLDLLDAEWPIGLNPLAGIDLAQAGGSTQALGMVLSVFSCLDPEAWGKSVGMQQYAQMATMLVLDGEPHPTVANLKQALQDDVYRSRLLPRCTNIEVRNFWEVTFPKTGEQQKLSRDALLRRLDNLLVDELTRYILTLPVPTFDIGQAMEDGDILLFPLPHNTLGELAPFIAMLVFQGIVRAAFRRPGTDVTRPTVPLLIDELQVFLGDGDSEDVRDAVTRLRGLGIGGVYAHQSLTQLGDLRDEMLQNASSRLILRTGEPDASAYARLYPTTDLTPADVAGQDATAHQYAVLVGPSGTPEICSISPPGWPAPRDVDADLPPYRGPNWQTVLPPERRASGGVRPPLTDREIAQLVYGPGADVRAESARLARLPDAEWQALLARWDAIRAHQRAFIIQNPGCVPERMARQRWLSRLRAACPRVLAAALYQRQRWAIAPGEQPAAVAPRAATPAAPRPASPAVIPGLAPTTPPPPPVIDAARSREAIYDARGRRRGAAAQDGFQDLPGEEPGT
ncbi:MAG: hypothetical protein RLZZ387_2912 [Chloroflexota bacterium]|jgi:hypothetical protein